MMGSALQNRTNMRMVVTLRCKLWRRSHADRTSMAQREGGESKVGGSAGMSVQAMCGAAAGGVARVAVAPLDVIKIRLQVQQEPLSTGKYNGSVAGAAATIAREEGARGLWRGSVPGLLLWMPYNGVQFSALGQANRLAERAGLRPNGPLVAIASGAFAASAATLASYPLDLLRTVLSAQGHPPTYAGPWEASRGVVRARGLQGLFAGVAPTLLEIAPSAGVQFGAYSALRQTARDLSESSELGGWQGYTCGFVAGALGKAAVHPLDVVKKRFQVAGVPRDAKYGQSVSVSLYSGIFDCFRKVVESEGARSLFKGVVPNVVKAAPASAVTFGTYELLIKAATSFTSNVAFDR
jgi:solute carrier family 25 thiamine pyrophosphate transporter 19